MSVRPSGIAVEVERRKFLLPLDRVAFVVPVRNVAAGMLVLPRGTLPLVDPRPRLGLPPTARPQNAVAVKGRLGFYALAVDDVELLEAVPGGIEPALPRLDPESFLTEEEERALFPEGAIGPS